MAPPLPCLGCASDAQPVTNGVATANAFTTACVLLALGGPGQLGAYLAFFCEQHREVSAKVIAWMAQANGLTVAEVTRKLGETIIP